LHHIKLVFLFGTILLKKDQPKYEIDKTKITKFLSAVLFVFVLNFLYCFIFTDDLGAVLLFSLLNMSFINYCLVYWVLFKEKKSKNHSIK